MTDTATAPPFTVHRVHPLLFADLNWRWREQGYDLPRRYRLNPADATALRAEAKDKVEDHGDGSFGFVSDFGYLSFRPDEAVTAGTFRAEGEP